MISVVASSLLGLAFFECVRIYRCIRLEKKFFPNIGFSKAASKLVYVFVMAVFIATAIFITLLFELDDPVKAFLLGFAVPSGAHLAGGGMKEGDEIDDMESEQTISEMPLAARLAYWFQAYAE
ncbi:hypothetical protein [Shimia sp. R9_3]|uniref:hypothetical protein n=1 Tax=Shimia sp. R9_3 TaxID=2821113 RepID=UPI001ADC6FF7|nr:hypothetical protein [Shimia sp. R9_3]MBO9403438.1 hypothetical protein [Shimia sp. R9_3]